MEGHSATLTQPGGFKSAHPGFGVPSRTQELSRAPLQQQEHPWVLHPTISPGATSIPRPHSDRIAAGWGMSLCPPGTSPRPSTQNSAPQHPSPPATAPSTAAGSVTTSSSRLTHSKSRLIPLGIPSREKEGRVEGVSGQGLGERGEGAPPSPQGAHPSDVPAGLRGPFPDRRGESAAGAGEGRRRSCRGRRQPRSGGLALLSHF